LCFLRISLFACISSRRESLVPPFSALIIAFLHPFASCLCRRILSIPTTSHILVSATYNHLGSFTLLPPMLGIHGFFGTSTPRWCANQFIFYEKNYIEFDCNGSRRRSLRFGGLILRPGSARSESLIRCFGSDSGSCFRHLRSNFCAFHNCGLIPGALSQSDLFIFSGVSLSISYVLCLSFGIFSPRTLNIPFSIYRTRGRVVRPHRHIRSPNPLLVSNESVKLGLRNRSPSYFFSFSF
jgi:hypothetical protein